jgi:hypothetical protein
VVDDHLALRIGFDVPLDDRRFGLRIPVFFKPGDKPGSIAFVTCTMGFTIQLDDP